MDSARACTQQLVFRDSHEYGNLPGEEIKHSNSMSVSSLSLTETCNNLSIKSWNKGGSFIIPLPFWHLSEIFQDTRQGHQIRTQDKDTRRAEDTKRGGHKTRTRDKEPRKGNQTRTPAKDTKQGNNTRTQGKDTKQGRQRRTPDKDTRQGHKTRTQGQQTRTRDRDTR